jgi:hypothetical protein
MKVKCIDVSNRFNASPEYFDKEMQLVLGQVYDAEVHNPDYKISGLPGSYSQLRFVVVERCPQCGETH